MSSFRRGGRETSFRGRLIETGHSSSFSLNQDNFPTLPSAKAYSSGGSPSSQHKPAHQAAHPLPDISHQEQSPAHSQIPTEVTTDPPSHVPMGVVNNFPYAVPIVTAGPESIHVTPHPQQVYREVFHTTTVVPNIPIKTTEDAMQSQGTRYLQPQLQPAFYPQQIYQPIIYDNDSMVPQQFVRVVAPADYAGLMAQPQHMWINPGAAVHPYTQMIMPTARSSSVTKVDRGSDAILWPKSEVKGTQTCLEDLQSKVATPKETAANSVGNWDVPHINSGEQLHGWDDLTSPDKKKSRNKDTNQSQKIDSLEPEISVLGNKDKSVSKREKSRSPSKKGKSRSPARDRAVRPEKFDHAKIDMDVDVNDGGDDSAEIDFKRINQQAEEYRKAQLASMIPIIKDVYKEHPHVSYLSDDQIEVIRVSMNITARFPKPEELSPVFNIDTKDLAEEYSKMSMPKPVTTFEQAFKDFPEILGEVAKQGFSAPTPIQCQLWPCIMKGHDVVGIAQTGSGKTLGFLLPAFIHIEKQVKPRAERNSPTVLVLAPTRELAQQIHKEVMKYNYKGIKSVCLYGGNPRSEQIDSLRRNPEIVIATPGRLNDLINSDVLNLKEVSFLILDEADEMLDQGFEPQINKALMRVRSDRQTILTSATWPESVRRMAKNYTKNPIMVVIGTVELKAVGSVKQNIIILDETEKYNWLIDFLKTKMDEKEKLIVFVGRKAFADHLSSELSLLRLQCVCIHGGLPQCERDRAIQDMKSGDSRVLIASDVVARGIDIELVTYIINYDVPKSSEMYIHRIGRTGRAGNTGESFTLVTRRDWNKAQDLINILNAVGQEVPEELVNMAERYKNRRDQDGEFRGGRGGRGRGGGGGFRQEGEYGRQGFSNFGGGSDSYGGNRGSDSYGSNRGSDSFGANRSSNSFGSNRVQDNYGSSRGGHRPRAFGDYQSSGQRENEDSWSSESNSRGQGGYQGRGRGRSYDNN